MISLRWEVQEQVGTAGHGQGEEEIQKILREDVDGNAQVENLQQVIDENGQSDIEQELEDNEQPLQESGHTYEQERMQGCSQHHIQEEHDPLAS